MTTLRPEPLTSRADRTHRALTIASVPARHVYVEHLTAEDPTDGSVDAAAADQPVRRLADPDPADPSRPATGAWWPPVMLRPEWPAGADAADVDVFHLHFGFDASTPAELRALVAALHERGTPLVYTVHDLRNPHHEDRAAHDAQLDVLVPAADALVTLTPGAAAEIRRRWGRDALVVPHPHVVPLATMARVAAERAGRRTTGFRVGLHLKSLRANLDPLRVLPTLAEVVAELPGAVLQVNAHRDVVEAGGPRFDPALAAWLVDRAAAGAIELVVHDYLGDEELWTYLASLDAAVLSYRFGTHSGWLEACRDLGTAVIAPSCGYLAEQGPVLGYVHDEDAFDPASLRAAVVAAYEGRAPAGATVAERRAQRADVAAAHTRLYRSVLA